MYMFQTYIIPIILVMCHIHKTIAADTYRYNIANDQNKKESNFLVNEMMAAELTMNSHLSQPRMIQRQFNRSKKAAKKGKKKTKSKEKKTKNRMPRKEKKRKVISPCHRVRLRYQAHSQALIRAVFHHWFHRLSQAHSQARSQAQFHRWRLALSHRLRRLRFRLRYQAHSQASNRAVIHHWCSFLSILLDHVLVINHVTQTHWTVL